MRLISTTIALALASPAAAAAEGPQLTQDYRQHGTGAGTLAVESR